MKRPATPIFPVIVALAVMLFFQASTHLTQVGLAAGAKVARYQPPRSVFPMEESLADFTILLRAGEGYLEGIESYAEISRYAQQRDPWRRAFPLPPITYRLFFWLSALNQPAACLIWFVASLLVFPLSLVLLFRRALPNREVLGLKVVVLTVICFYASASTLLEVERGNYNWLVLSLYLLGLVLLSRRLAVAGGLLIGLAGALKIYPLIVLPGLWMSGKKRGLLGVALALAAVLVVTGWSNNIEWISRVADDRANWLYVSPMNVSLANLIGWLTGARSARTAPAITGSALLVLGILLSAFYGVLFRQFRRGVRPGMLVIGLLLLPFMSMMPSTTWSYNLFSLIPLLMLCAAIYQSQPQSRTLVTAVAVLIGICQSPLLALPLQVEPVRYLLGPVYSGCLLLIGVSSILLLHRHPASLSPRPESETKESPQNKRYETGRVGGAQSRARPEEKPQK